MSGPSVTIVVATHNRPTMLAVMLNSILASAATVSNPVRIVVVDDASETMEAQAIAKRLCRSGLAVLRAMGRR
jgi:glycosyltransferase involved in cell wall biosynthesis